MDISYSKNIMDYIIYFGGIVTGWLLHTVYTEFKDTRNDYQKVLDRAYLDLEEEDFNNPSKLSEVFKDTEGIKVADLDKNTIVLKLTDSAILKLLDRGTTQENKTCENIFLEAEETSTTATETPKNVLSSVRSATSMPPTKYIYLDNIGSDSNTLCNNYALPRSEERKILRQFNDIVNKPLEEAKKIVAGENYSLHVLYVGMGKKMPLQTFSSTTIGVRIRDPGWEGFPSKEAYVTELIDVGGIDSRNAGQINL